MLGKEGWAHFVVASPFIFHNLLSTWSYCERVQNVHMRDYAEYCGVTVPERINQPKRLTRSPLVRNVLMEHIGGGGVGTILQPKVAGYFECTLCGYFQPKVSHFVAIFNPKFRTLADC